jgi:pimeloyl-ACP methyl ester carboxylesterase
MHSVRDHVPSFDGTPIYYEVCGDGEPALVFIHGWCCKRSYWVNQLSEFAQRHKVVAVDLAGHGESGLDRKAWTIPAFGEDDGTANREYMRHFIMDTNRQAGEQNGLEYAETFCHVDRARSTEVQKLEAYIQENALNI